MNCLLFGTKMSRVSFYSSQWSRLPSSPTGDHLKGKTVILTGAKSGTYRIALPNTPLVLTSPLLGLGLVAANQLAALQPDRLVLAVRSLPSGREALDSILRTHPGVNVDVWELDLASFRASDLLRSVL